MPNEQTSVLEEEVLKMIPMKLLNFLMCF